MVAKDFEYDGEFLKDWGYMICSTDSPSGFEAVVSDSQLTFDAVSQLGGKLFNLTSSYYENRIEITFQIGKYSCREQTFSPISVFELRAIKRWLNRPDFHKFKLIQPGWADIYMEGSFNVTHIEFSGQIYFLELTFISNRPFALHEPITHVFQTTSSDKEYSFFDISDEIGYIYPDMKITCLEDGDLEIANLNEDRTTLIKGCKKNEIITFSKLLTISTSLASHKIQNDFNFIFPRIANTYNNRRNVFTLSKQAKVELTYSPYVKAVM